VTVAVFRTETRWALEGRYVDDIRRAAASEFEVFQARSDEDVARRLAETEVMYGFRLDGDSVKRAARLKWVQATSAGIERALFPEFVNSSIVLTSASGIHAVQISEHALAMMLSLARKLPQFVRRQAKGVWDTAPSDEMGEVYEKTLGIVGLGNIGEALAVRAKALGMRVVGVKNSPLGYNGAADEVMGPGAMERVFRESDYVVALLPVTAGTTGIISAAMIAAMKPTAFFVNLGRGATVDEEALVAAIEYGKIAGAGLDVFAKEPLPARSKLWKMENVIITPHVAGTSPRYWERATALFSENLRRYAAGEELLNVVDKEMGY
jgi:phosphoglycerate dehydrogenase-like enzyme